MSPPDSSAEDESPSRSEGTSAGKADQGSGQGSIDMVLGEALAGVTLGANQAGGNLRSGALSSAGSSPFSLPANEGDGWGNYTDAAQVAFPSTGPSAIPMAAGSPTFDATPTTPGLQPRNDGFDLFLSQNAQKALGNDDVFRFSHPNLSTLTREEGKSPQPDPSFRYGALVPGPTPPGSYGEIRQPEGRRRTESPSCSVTGTTTSSRSASPYTNSSVDVGNGVRAIHAYPRYDSTNQAPEGMWRNQPSFAEDDRSSSGYNSMSHGHGSHPSLATLDSAHRSPYSKDRTSAYRNSMSSSPAYDSGPDRSSGHQSDMMPIQQPQVMAANGHQPQVLYMPVPSPDGRGQVLQPVQVVQLPGKSYHFVPAGGVGTPPHDTVSLPRQPSSGDFQQLMGGAEPRLPVENRSRLANYAIDTSTNRQYSLDTAVSRDEFRSTSSSPQYQVDPLVASLYSAPQRPSLDALLGQVRRLSRDQVGCRLVQQALDEDGPTAATLILNEGLPFWGEAMIDPFGNYLFQKILEKATPDERILLVKSVSPRLVNASLNLHGTRSVQKIVELCSQDEQASRQEDGRESAADILTAALAPAAARLCIDSHGNHVIQRILLKFGPQHTKFVFDAVAASVGDVARHRHGCCVIQRCLDSPPNEARHKLVLRIVEKSLELMQDAYGNYVVQYVLDVCSDEDVHAVCESVVGKVNLLAIQKFSSNVMEKCLERCSDRVKEMYLAEMSDPERIRELMMDPFGNYVVQRALSVATHAQAIRLVEAMRPHLMATQTSGPHGQRNGGVRNTAGGRRIIAKICRRFPNFTLSAVGSQDELYSSGKASHLHHSAPVLASYAPVGLGTTPHGQHFATDLRMPQGHMPVQQQSYYTFGGSPYYEHQFADHFDGSGGFPGM